MARRARSPTERLTFPLFVKIGHETLVRRSPQARSSTTTRRSPKRVGVVSPKGRAKDAHRLEQYIEGREIILLRARQRSTGLFPGFGKWLAAPCPTGRRHGSNEPVKLGDLKYQKTSRYHDARRPKDLDRTMERTIATTLQTRLTSTRMRRVRRMDLRLTLEGDNLCHRSQWQTRTSEYGGFCRNSAEAAGNRLRGLIQTQSSTSASATAAAWDWRDVSIAGFE